MSMKKLLVYWVLLTVAPMVAMAQKHAFSNGLYWELNNGVLTISGNGAIPNYYGSAPWGSSSNIKKIVIEAGISSIENEVFSFYKNLQYVYIPQSVVSIGKRAFYDCENLISVNFQIPSKLTRIGFQAFQESGIESITIPNSVKKLEDNSFCDCKKLRSITIPNSVSEIGAKAFHGDERLTSVEIPSSITTIHNGTFEFCFSLASVTIPNSVTSIEKHAFFRCTNLYLEIPSSVTSIEEDAFYGTKSVTMPITTPNGENYFLVREADYDDNKKHGIKNKDGNWTIPITKFSYVSVLTDGYLIVRKNGKSGLVFVDGKEIVPPELDAVGQCGKGYLRYKLNGFWGVMNYQGKIIIDTNRGYTSIGDFKTFNKRFAYTMNGYKGECDATGRQISKIKVDTPRQATTSSSSPSSSSSSSNSNSGNNTTTIHVEHHRDPVPVQEWHACIGCGGMGTMGCDFCGGSGTKYIGDRLHRCSRCNGRGIIPCNVCYGNKGQYITVYK